MENMRSSVRPVVCNQLSQLIHSEQNCNRVSAHFNFLTLRVELYCISEFQLLMYNLVAIN